MAVLFGFGLNQLVLTWAGVRREALIEGPVPDPSAPPIPATAVPVVTIQLPLYNERFVAERLIDACARIDYPRERLEIQVLDDSTDDTAAIVSRCVEKWRSRGMDITHVRRAHRDGFKAGALANGLSFARGDLIAIFDADFLPPSDFLQRTIPGFEDVAVGLVQARWSHVNQEQSLLTDAQAALLDAHFLVEQGGRAAAGWLFSFNGTAGIWRRQCIEEAGGWQADTLTEDLDLSYRAQLAGWRFLFVPTVDVPAELPDTSAAWREQQFRWTKGTAETARKLYRRLVRADLPAGARTQAAMHLCGFAVYPAILAVALTHAPLLAAHRLELGVSDAFLGAMGIGLFALAGMVTAHLIAQRTLHPDWPSRLARFPWWLIASMGLAVNNTRAAAQALLGRRSPFIRTPKGGYQDGTSRMRFLEIALAGYGVTALVGLVAIGAWVAVPFQLIFCAAFASAAWYDPPLPAIVPSS